MIADLRALEPPQLESFTNSLVEQVVAAVTDKIPHLESSLAVAELTVALHYVLNTPEDVLVWDVGHQAYVHNPLLPGNHYRALTVPEIPRNTRLSFSFIIKALGWNTSNRPFSLIV